MLKFIHSLNTFLLRHQELFCHWKYSNEQQQKWSLRTSRVSLSIKKSKLYTMSDEGTCYKENKVGKGQKGVATLNKMV